MTGNWYEPVAVIGFAGRFPGAAGVAEYWDNLQHERETLTRFSDAQLTSGGVDPGHRADPAYVPVRGVLDDADLFDNELFGISPRDAEITDPQHRVLLECAWQALEHAGYPEERGHRTGVFAGTTISTYLLRHLLSSPEHERDLGTLALMLANDKDHAATRIAYRLGLSGPALAVQTACSTSLVAVHLAAQSLLRDECEIAVAGGASVQFPQQTGYLYDRNGILSPDGHCRAFDAKAAGTVGGSGAALVVLKRLDRALADRDSVHAVIRGSAINNDGSRKVGYTAPSIAGQTEVIRAALAAARLSADTIGYVETHGTGTELGDAIEITALTNAFRQDTERTGYCAIGSVKPNIGHLDAAAGVAGLLKAVLAVRDGVLPASINCDEPHPDVDWRKTPFTVNRKTRAWTTDGDAPRRAGVSSFGIGGTNAHVVVEAPPVRKRAAVSRGPHLFQVSGHTREATATAARQLATHLADGGTDLRDAAFTSQSGRRLLAWRLSAVAESGGEAADRLGSALAVHSGRTTPVFLFPGQGAQRSGMARDLYSQVPAVREMIDECATTLLDLIGTDIRELICAAGDDEKDSRLTATSLAQPALFAVEYAIGRFLLDAGVRPRMMIGHSLGEYVAATLGGAMRLPDALTLVAHRGMLMQTAPLGSMVAVLAPADVVARHAPPGVDVAGHNAPAVTVVSGDHASLARLSAALADSGIRSRPLRVSHAFHSAAMDPILKQFHAYAGKIRYSRLRHRVLSNVTGQPMDPNGYSADYWTTHLRSAVRFSDAITVALGATNPIFVEVGPGRSLSSLVELHETNNQPVVVATMAGEDRRGGHTALLDALGTMWANGVAVRPVADAEAGRVPLPTYPFQRRRFWIDAAASRDPGTPTAEQPAAVERRSAKVAVADMWDRLLGTRSSDGDNFFALGGDSLLCVRLIAMIRREFKVSIALADLVGAPTLGEQIQLVDSRLETEHFATGYERSH